MRKYKHEEIKSFFSEKNMQLLSKEYKDNQQKLRCKCLECGYIGTKTLGNLLMGGGCLFCKGTIKYTYKQAKSFFSEKNMVLLSKRYEGCNQKLKYKCLICSYVGEKRLSNLLKGEGCPSCVGVLKYTYEKVRDIFAKKNLKLLTKKYKNNKQKLKYKCLKCRKIGEKSLHNLLKTKGCSLSCSMFPRYTHKEVKKCFADYNMELLNKKYKNFDILSRLKS